MQFAEPVESVSNAELTNGHHPGLGCGEPQRSVDRRPTDRGPIAVAIARLYADNRPSFRTDCLGDSVSTVPAFDLDYESEAGPIPT